MKGPHKKSFAKMHPTSITNFFVNEKSKVINKKSVLYDKRFLRFRTVAGKE